MEWSERMNLAIDYIEKNLDDEININEVAKIACCSSHHFQRIFFVIIGITPAEYARRRRLTLAARELIATNTRIIDIALKYGFDSPNAFTRAFRNVHGINPRAARTQGAVLTAFPRISFHIELKGDSNMDYKIVEKSGFDAVAKGRQFTTDQEQSFIELPKFWDEFRSDKSWDTLMKFTGGTPGAVTGAGSLGICTHEDANYYYGIGAEKGSNAVPKGFDEIHLPAATWAVFDSYGPVTLSIQAVIKKIFSEWFPSTGYEHALIPELQVYLPGDMQSRNYHCQVWIPVVKKD
jgi:AraC family transcriptional regulator